ncbi:hypothetical protein UFOVP273_72 [uncultured Caudovirales phage]|uniref:Uncharacterized protein n=1 Tax=uncultured Caudovirales phage TaxID=2100421 RepID=A0A6J5LM42_9CAUD|nr:hypothetical protein UFOVP273_72 [uncultured Caudovirales phage]
MEKVTAEYARSLTEHAKSLQGEVAKKETEDILGAIKLAASAGKSEVSIKPNYEHRLIITKRLEQLGFRVRFISGYQRDPDYYVVSW